MNIDIGLTVPLVDKLKIEKRTFAVHAQFKSIL
jgi:hypothetical protein